MVNRKRVTRKIEHPPLHSRRCVGCGKYDTRENLIRVVRHGTEFSVEYNKSGSDTHAAGRGAYVHAQNSGCVKRAVNGGLARSLKRAVPESVLKMLETNG